jgi:hypothetical protein
MIESAHKRGYVHLMSLQGTSQTVKNSIEAVRQTTLQHHPWAGSALECVQWSSGSGELCWSFNRAKAIKQGSVDGAGVWLGHAQHIIADNNCTAKQDEHIW